MPNSTTDKSNIAAIAVIALIAGIIGGAFIAPRLQLSKNLTPSERLPGQMQEKEAGTLRETVYLDEESATINVVEKTNRAVVSVSVLKDINKFRPDFNDPFQDFFFEFGFPFERRVVPSPRPERESEPNFQPVGGGSGFVIDSDGLIVTNKHVVDDPEAQFKVVLSDGEEYDAEILAKDPVLDVAIIKVEAENLPVLTLGDSDKLKLGQTVIAIGNALSEFGNTVTRGVVSGVNRTITAGAAAAGFSEVIEEAIQTDAAINPGNSGGPLLNLAGEVIGINTAVSLEGQLIGFAIPINSVKNTIESVRETGRIVRPWLGVRFMPINSRAAELNDLKVQHGALIVRGSSPEELAIIPGSPADKAGLMENDIILEIEGKKLDQHDSLAKEISKYEVGEVVALKVLHKGEEKEIKVKLGEFPTKL